MGFQDLAWTPSLRRPERVGGDLGRDRTGVIAHLEADRTVFFGDRSQYGTRSLYSRHSDDRRAD